MGDSENVAAVRRYVDAFYRLDLDAATSGLDREIELREWPEAPGAQALLTLHQRAKGRTSAVEAEIRSYNVYTFRDGLVTLAELFIERENALAAAELTEEDIRQEAT